MNKLTLLSLGFAALISVRAPATVVIDGNQPDSNHGTTTIEHGHPPQWTEYSLIDGTEDIVGQPEYDRRKALLSWNTACVDWKNSMKELNTDRQLLTLNCAAPTQKKEGDLITYSSVASYKMKVRTKERR